MAIKICTLWIAFFLLGDPAWPLRHARTQTECLENLELRRELPNIVLGCELPGCYPGYDGATEYRMMIRYRDELQGSLLLRLPESSQTDSLGFTIMRGEVERIDKRTIRLTSGEVEMAYSLPQDADRRLVVVPRIEQAEDPPIPEAPGQEVGQLLEVVQRVNGIRINQYLDVVVFRRCRLPEEIDVCPVEPSRVLADPAARVRPAMPTVVSPEQDRVTVSNIQDTELLILISGFQQVGAGGRCELRLHRAFPNSNTQELTIGNLLGDDVTCPAVVAVFGKSHAPSMITNLSPTPGGDDFGVLQLAPVTPLPITIFLSGSHGGRAALEDRIFCELAVANHIYLTFYSGVRLVPTLVDRSSFTTLPAMDGSAKICAELSQEFQASTGLVASYHDLDDPHGLNCRDHRFPRLNYLGRFTAPATLGHEVGHAFELCHGFSGNIENLMTPRRRERDLYIGQAFWLNFSVHSFLRQTVAVNGSICCFERDGAGTCPDLQLDPAPDCRDMMASSAVCPDQTVPFDSEDRKLLPEKQQDKILEWLSCYDCEPEFLDEDILRDDADLMGEFLLNVLKNRSYAYEDSLSTYLDDIYTLIREDCPLSGLDFKALYNANESGHRLFQAASALILLLPAERIRLLLEQPDISSELKDVMRRAVTLYGVEL